MAHIAIIYVYIGIVDSLVESLENNSLNYRDNKKIKIDGMDCRVGTDFPRIWHSVVWSYTAA